MRNCFGILWERKGSKKDCYERRDVGISSWEKIVTEREKKGDCYERAKIMRN